MVMGRTLVILLLIGVVLACDEKVDDLISDQGYEFFPVTTGQYRMYEVDQVLFTGSVADTSHYFLKEVIADSIMSGDKTISYLLERYVNEDTITQSWELDSVWQVRVNNTQAVVIENNVPYVKMTFPVKAEKSWDGNALNSRQVQMYYYQMLSGYDLLGMSLNDDKVVKVVIADVSPNTVEQDQRSEVYVKGVGLVEKDYISVSFCQQGCETGEIEDGRIYRLSLVKYGEE